MKKTLSMMMVALMVAGTLSAYAGEGCSKCKKGDKDDQKTEKKAEDTTQAE